MIDFCVFNATVSNISLYHGEHFLWWKKPGYPREPPTMGKQLMSFITCGCASSAPFCNLQSRDRTHAVLVIGLHELLRNPTTYLIEPPGPLWSMKDYVMNHMTLHEVAGSV